VPDQAQDRGPFDDPEFAVRGQGVADQAVLEQRARAYASVSLAQVVRAKIVLAADGVAEHGDRRAARRASRGGEGRDQAVAVTVRRNRKGQIQPPPGTALRAAADARNRKGKLLPERVAATTLLNVLRPTVAVAWFVAFAGKALHEHPEWRKRIAGGDEAALNAFAHEVRRLYPFVPVLAARARTAQDVLGVRVPRGGLVVLDVHGTDHDRLLARSRPLRPDPVPAGQHRARRARAAGWG
jgi:cytochrome P450